MLPDDRRVTFQHAVREFRREMARQDEVASLLKAGARLLNEAGIATVRLVHWDGQRVLAEGGRGRFEADAGELPACLMNQGSCLNCRWRERPVADSSVTPLRRPEGCEGAVFLSEPMLQADESASLGELGEDLSFTLARLGRLKRVWFDPSAQHLKTIFDRMMAGILIVRLRDRRIGSESCG